MPASDEQPENALAPSENEPLRAGNTNFVRDEQPAKAFIAINSKALPLKTTSSSDVQFLNSPCPIFVTAAGRLIDSSAPQPSKVLQFFVLVV